MNAHTRLKLHLERHAYKRGAHKGDAPLDSTRRGKTHWRVMRGNGGQMLVRMWGTEVMTAYEDGTIVLRASGWEHSPTTRQCINYALGFAGFGRIHSLRKWGISHTVVTVGSQSWLYYDGMEFSADGKLMSPPMEFDKRITDTDETAEFRREIKESGFVDMFPVLFAAASADDRGYVRSAENAMTNEHLAHQWPSVVSHVKYGHGYRNAPLYDNHKDALRALIASITKNMKVTIKSGVTVL